MNKMGINKIKFANLARQIKNDGVYSNKVTLTPSMPMVVTSRSIMFDVGGSRVWGEIKDRMARAGLRDRPGDLGGVSGDSYSSLFGSETTSGIPSDRVRFSASIVVRCFSSIARIRLLRMTSAERMPRT